MILPNVFIVGFPKAATSSVHRWLADHPDACGSQPKETHYFIDRDWSSFSPQANYLDHGLDAYATFFDADTAAASTVVFESSVEYVFQKTALDVLPDMSTKPRFVFVLREPSAQIYSLFQYLRNNHGEIPADMSFRQYVDQIGHASELGGINSLLRRPLENCRYAQHLDAWAARCTRERMFVYLFDDLLRDPRLFMTTLATDLGLNPRFYDNYSFAAENESYAVKAFWLQRLNIRLRRRLGQGALYRALRAIYRTVNTSKASASVEDMRIRQTLREQFATDNRRLAERYGLDLSAWQRH